MVHWKTDVFPGRAESYCILEPMEPNTATESLLIIYYRVVFVCYEQELRKHYL